MNKIKAVFVDYDGTLIKSDGMVSQRTKDTIKRFIAGGGKFYINTGRVGTSAVDAAKEIGTSRYVASCQGGAVYDLENGDSLAWDVTIPKDRALDIATWLESKGAYFQIYPTKGGYATEKYVVPYTDYYENACNKKANILGEKASEYMRREDVRLAKILVIFDDVIDPEFLAELKSRYGDTVRTSVSRQAPTYFEINDPMTAKGEALKRIAEIEGIDISECAAIGDQNNDMSMIVAAGVGVAVANATAELKAAADILTLSNDEDGVAYFIEKFCLGDEQ